MRNTIYKLIFTMLLCTVTINAMVVTQKSFKNLYLSIFDNTSDVEDGYWLELGVSLENVSEIFFEQRKLEKQYPLSLDVDFILYLDKNLFKKEIHSLGVKDLILDLKNGKILKSKFMLEVLKVVEEDNNQILATKTKVAQLFAYAFLSDIRNAQRILADVTSEVERVELAKRVIGFMQDTTYEAISNAPISIVNSVDAQSIIHNGITYGFVTSPHTGRIWLDRNLGAARVCISVDDVACYGDYYQFGRNADGHEDSASSITNITSPVVDPVGHGDFIVSRRYWNDSDVDANSSLKILNWSNVNGRSVCPVGFRVPTAPEVAAETLDVNIGNIDDLFNDFLKLPAAGGRSDRGVMALVNSWAFLWTTTTTSNYHADLFAFANDNFVRRYSLPVASGESVRCIRD